ncbi:MAG TPA: hypothetical protein VNW97_14520 [Candidatus Saccharimonadales bacterium]|jgi:hypothetical protein|nr:hypothetical protein [Candidatus Saccharimonadales bacterium]
MGFDMTNMAGRGAMDLNTGVKTGVDQGAGGIAPMPPDRNDAQYKMGIGHRLLGIANNFLQGMAHRGPVTYTGRGATNGKYDHAMEDYRNMRDRVVAKPMTTTDPASGGGGATVQPEVWRQDDGILRYPGSMGGPQQNLRAFRQQPRQFGVAATRTS